MWKTKTWIHLNANNPESTAFQDLSSSGTLKGNAPKIDTSEDKTVGDGVQTRGR